MPGYWCGPEASMVAQCCRRSPLGLKAAAHNPKYRNPHLESRQTPNGRQPKAQTAQKKRLKRVPTAAAATARTCKMGQYMYGSKASDPTTNHKVGKRSHRRRLLVHTHEHARAHVHTSWQVYRHAGVHAHTRHTHTCARMRGCRLMSTCPLAHG